LIRFLSLLLLISCRSIPTNSQNECSAPPQSHAGAMPLDTLMQLPGKYSFTTVATSPGLDGSPVRAQLILRAADTLERYYEQRLNGFVRAGNRPLVGQLAWHYPDGSVRSEPVVVQQNPADTQLISGFCGNCTDAMLVYHTILQLRANEFSGRWSDPQTGIGRVVDKNGRELPNPAGYFCAIRVS
jgi:hypothetical protein